MKEVTGRFGFEMVMGESRFIMKKPRFSPIILVSIMGGLMGLAAIAVSIFSILG